MKIDLQDLKLVPAPAFGYEFNLEVQFSGRQGARLYWLEKVSQLKLGPPDAKCPEPSTASTWQNIYALDGGVEGSCPTFAGWRATRNNRGGVSLTLPAQALIQLKPSVQRTLEYWVVVVDGDTLHWGQWQAKEFLQTNDKAIPLPPPVSFFRAQATRYGDDGAPPFPKGFDPYQTATGEAVQIAPPEAGPEDESQAGEADAGKGAGKAPKPTGKRRKRSKKTKDDEADA